ncbi:MAG: UTP--glucose-1-phosphate uridylyltransferase GalU [Magnetococcales bacterium]|nr:UTP--glucose-1-phosphate uridylyltransferase GalU [Magnetococcales bacterium]
MKVRKAVLPVAGMGTRFLPATKAVPKEMLPVVDRPLIQYAVEEAWAAGIEQVIFVSSRGKDAMADHFDRAPELERSLREKGKDKLLQAVENASSRVGDISMVRQDNPRGLGHAVWCARELVGNEPFAILLPDDMMWNRDASGAETTPVLKQMVDEFERLSSSIIAVMEVDPNQSDKYGVVDPMGEDGDSIQAKGLVEKPPAGTAPSNLAVIGRYVLTPRIFDLLGRQGAGAGGEIQLTDAMAQLLKEQSIYGYRFKGQRFDCGDKTGYQMANLALAMEQTEIRQRLLPFIKQQLPGWSA